MNALLLNSMREVLSNPMVLLAIAVTGAVVLNVLAGPLGLVAGGFFSTVITGVVGAAMFGGSAYFLSLSGEGNQKSSSKSDQHIIKQIKQEKYSMKIKIDFDKTNKVYIVKINKIMEKSKKESQKIKKYDTILKFVKNVKNELRNNELLIKTDISCKNMTKTACQIAVKELRLRNVRIHDWRIKQ